MSLVNFSSPKVQIQPSEHLEFFIDKNKDTSSSLLKISSKSNYLTVCRLKSSSPKDFVYETGNIEIKPLGEVEIKIIYKFSLESFSKFHKFLLQTTVVKDNANADWKGPGIYEYKLFAKFTDVQYLPKPENKAEPEEEIKEEIVPKEVVKNENKKRKCGSRCLKLVRGGMDSITFKRFSILHMILAFVMGWLASLYYPSIYTDYIR